jgi:hypothetical protein
MSLAQHLHCVSCSAWVALYRVGAVPAQGKVRSGDRDGKLQEPQPLGQGRPCSDEQALVQHQSRPGHEHTGQFEVCPG